MKVSLFSVIMSIIMAGAMVLAISTSFISATDQLAEAMTHAKTAVLQGQQGYPDDFIKHAQEAVDHAEMAKRSTTSPHLDKAIKELKFAVNDAKNGYVEDAIETVQSALEHLTSVSKSR